MTRKLSSLLVIAAALTIGFSSCSDNSTPDPAPAKDIAKTYTDTELQVTNEGEAVTGGTVKIEAIDNTKAKLTFDGIINGQATFEMNADVIQTKAEYAFQGTKTIDGMKVTAKGNVIDGVAAVQTEIEITEQSVLKSWVFDNLISEDTMYYNALTFNFETRNDLMTIIDEEGNTRIDSTKNFNAGIQMMGSIAFYMAFSSDFAFTFNKNGYVGIKGKSNYSPVGSQDIDIPKLARYYYSPTAKMLMFDAPLDGLMGAMGLSGTMQVPFKCSLNNGIFSATLDPEFLAPFIPMIPTGADLDELLAALDGSIPPDMAEMLPWLKANIKTLVYNITDEDNFESLSIGCNLRVAPTPAPAAN